MLFAVMEDRKLIWNY